MLSAKYHMSVRALLAFSVSLSALINSLWLLIVTYLVRGEILCTGWWYFVPLLEWLRHSWRTRRHRWKSTPVNALYTPSYDNRTVIVITLPCWVNGSVIVMTLSWWINGTVIMITLAWWVNGTVITMTTGLSTGRGGCSSDGEEPGGEGDKVAVWWRLWVRTCCRTRAWTERRW